MSQLKTTALLFLFSLKLYGQINPADSTVQVIAYWDNKEKETFVISSEKYKVKGTDTSARESSTCEVDVTVKDSTAKSYTIEWFYKNYHVQSDNPYIKRLASLMQDMRVVIKTDEMGVFTEVVNWQEVKAQIIKATEVLKKEFKDTPKIDETVNQIQKTFSTKEAIQSIAIKEIIQFYTFHGAKYKLGEEMNAKVKIANAYGGLPFDADIAVILDEINFKDANSILRAYQTVDSKQLTDASYEYIKKLAASTGAIPPGRSEIPPLESEVRTAARIHVSGWIIYSVETKKVTAENVVNFEERVIELK